MEATPPPAQCFVYETLTPLDQSPYSVFRNQISLSTIECASLDVSAPDFFSLDVGASDELCPVPVSEPPQAEDPNLEAGWFKGNTKFKSPMLQLHKEIVDFCDFLSPTPEEQAARNAAVDSVFSVIRYIWPNCQVEVFGSFRTGLYLPTSDIDVVILGSGIKTPQTGLYGLSRALSQRGIAKKIQVIAKARIPIIKFVEKTSGVAFDISFDVSSGPKAAEFIKDAVSKWPPLRPLCLILKVFLQQRELNEVYSGGVGSYALLVMLIAMLQSLRERQAMPEHNLGILLVHFFDFYGRRLNTADVGVSCKGRGSFYLKSSKGFVIKGRPFLISIEDPETPDNDIGKNSFNYFQIRSAFAMASSTLTNVKTILGLGENRSILGTIIRPDSDLVERKGGSNGEMTFDSLLPGAGKPIQLDESGDPEEMLCNWELHDEEDPLLRGNDIAEDATPPSSRKKRKASKEKSRKKVKDNGEVGKEENESRKEKSAKKRRKHSRSHQLGSSS